MDRVRIGVVEVECNVRSNNWAVDLYLGIGCEVNLSQILVEILVIC